MPSLIFNYGEWTYWEEYNPPVYSGNQSVTFDGPNRLILVNEGITTLDVQEDVYSNWKEWLTHRDNAKYLPAFATLGGDNITESTFIGDTYFLENGWRVQPWVPGPNGSSGYILDVVGNLYTREPGQNPVNPIPSVSVTLTRSNITETAIVGGTTTTTRLEEIWNILGLGGDQVITDTSISAGGITLTITQSEVGAGSTSITRE